MWYWIGGWGKKGIRSFSCCCCSFETVLSSEITVISLIYRNLYHSANQYWTIASFLVWSPSFLLWFCPFSNRLDVFRRGTVACPLFTSPSPPLHSRLNSLVTSALIWLLLHTSRYGSCAMDYCSRSLKVPEVHSLLEQQLIRLGMNPSTIPTALQACSDEKAKVEILDSFKISHWYT